MMEFHSEALIKMAIAMLVGLIIGAEREYHNKTAGLRTLMLVSVGSCIFTILSIQIGIANPDRLAANIVTGIGFLGAGAIFKDENKVSGLTTATAIWLTAALGMCVGAGEYAMAIFGALVALIVLSLLIYLEVYIDRKNRARHYKIVCHFKNHTLHHYEKVFESFNLHFVRSTQSKLENEIIGNWKISGSIENHEKLANYLLSDPTIKQFEF